VCNHVIAATYFGRNRSSTSYNAFVYKKQKGYINLRILGRWRPVKVETCCSENTHTLCCVDCHLRSYYLQIQRDG